MMVAQPGFLVAAAAGIAAARDASYGDGCGADTHTAVTSWVRFTVRGLRVPCLRPLDPLAPLWRKLQEVDLVEAYAWWHVACGAAHAHMRPNHETVQGYVSTLNAWHERRTGVHLAGNFPLTRVHRMLSGYARLQSVAPLRLKRVGCRPHELSLGIRLSLNPSSALDCNIAALLECALVAVQRVGELASNKPGGAFDPAVHPTRADVSFSRAADGTLLETTFRSVNCKARGVEARRKLERHLPARGSFLSPGWLLYLLTEVVDPVPHHLRATTPLFRDPRHAADPVTRGIFTVARVRAVVRSVMTAAGKDGTAYGAHSLRIGGATARAYLDEPVSDTKAVGCWTSEAYLLYLRERRSALMRVSIAVCSAVVDDYENDLVDIDDADFDASDEA